MTFRPTEEMVAEAFNRARSQNPRTPPPVAAMFKEGDMLVAVKEIHPKVPKGTIGEVLVVVEDINEIHIQWNVLDWPFIKVTKGSPTNGYEKLPPRGETAS